MDLQLKRSKATPDGVFGQLLDSTGAVVAYTLEHAYRDAAGRWVPKVPPGSYVCIRGEHQLHSGPIETFCLQNVPGHSGILIHYGNTMYDSDGCILVGTSLNGNPGGTVLTQSRDAFARLMQLQQGVDSFTLVVS